MVKPSILRPCKAQEEIKDAYIVPIDPPSCNIKGNRVINMDAMSRCMTYFYRQHKKRSPLCMGAIYWPSANEITTGQGTKVITACGLCKYRTKSLTSLYEDIDENRFKTFGPNVAKLNYQIVNATFKSAIGYGGYSLLMASMDANCMSRSRYFEIASTIAPVVKSLGERSILANRDSIKSITAHIPGAVNKYGNHLVSCQMDTCYNNPPKGRGFSSPGTQSVTPTIENITKKGLIIGLSADNQLCSKGEGCDHVNCGLNYPSENSIASSERDSAYRSYHENMKDHIEIHELCHDGITGSSHQAGIQDAAVELNKNVPSSVPCVVHMGRGTSQQIYKCNLSEHCLQGRPRESVSKFKSSLGVALNRRCTMELRKARQLYRNNDQKFFSQVQAAKHSILPCFQNDHNLCKLHSLVCKGSLSSHPRHLPNMQYLKLTDQDINEISQKVIEYRLSAVRVKLQKDLLHTNRVETYHRSTLKLCPKYKTYSRHYVHRCFSSVHTDSE